MHTISILHTIDGYHSVVCRV